MITHADWSLSFVGYVLACCCRLVTAEEFMIFAHQKFSGFMKLKSDTDFEHSFLDSF